MRLCQHSHIIYILFKLLLLNNNRHLSITSHYFYHCIVIISLFIQHLHRALFTNIRALMRYLTNRIIKSLQINKIQKSKLIT